MSILWTIRAVAALVLAFLVGGCGRIDWNWDRAWWKEPRRVVRPSSPPGNLSAADHAESGDRGDSNDGGAANDRAVSVSRRPGQALSDPRLADPPVEVQQRRAQARQEGLGAERAYYQLYFESGADAGEDPRGEYTFRAVGATARAIASAVEMLYVPAGRSGSDQSCYLLYEDRREFEAARLFTDFLASAAGGAKAASNADPFAAAATAMIGVLNAGPSSTAAAIDDCIRRLTAASGATQLPDVQRWAADIWRARLLADYRYEYAASRDACAAAQERAADGSLERMTAMWWMADAWAMEGRPDSARSWWERILREYGEIGERAQIVRRAELNLDKISKR
jgi:hypothetical protein